MCNAVTHLEIIHHLLNSPPSNTSHTASSPENPHAPENRRSRNP